MYACMHGMYACVYVWDVCISYALDLSERWHFWIGSKLQRLSQHNCQYERITAMRLNNTDVEFVGGVSPVMSRLLARC